MKYYMLTYRSLPVNLRTKILNRDSHACAYKVYCVSKEPKLEIHHKDGNRLNNSDSNLITVCKKCHNFLDAELRIKNNETRAEKQSIQLECNYCSKIFFFRSHGGTKYCTRECYRLCQKEMSPLTRKARNLRQTQKRKLLYKNDPIFREKQRLSQKKSYQKTKQRLKTDPVFRDKFLLRNRENVRRHRLKAKCNEKEQPTA